MLRFVKGKIKQIEQQWKRKKNYVLFSLKIWMKNHFKLGFFSSSDCKRLISFILKHIGFSLVTTISKNKPGTISRASMQQELEDMDRVAVDHRDSEPFVPLLLQQHLNLKCKVVTGCLTINKWENFMLMTFDKYSNNNSLW